MLPSTVVWRRGTRRRGDPLDDAADGLNSRLIVEYFTSLSTAPSSAQILPSGPAAYNAAFRNPSVLLSSRCCTILIASLAAHIEPGYLGLLEYLGLLHPPPSPLSACPLRAQPSVSTLFVFVSPSPTRAATRRPPGWQTQRTPELAGSPARRTRDRARTCWGRSWPRTPRSSRWCPSPRRCGASPSSAAPRAPASSRARGRTARCTTSWPRRGAPTA